MPKKNFLLSLVIIIIQLIPSTVSFAKKDDKVPPVINKDNTALYNFSISIIDIDLSSYYSVDKKMMDDFYKTVSTALKDVNAMNLKPLKFLAGKIDYDNYGYPSSRGKKAVATNAADDYMNISISVSGTGLMNKPNESNSNDCVLSRKVGLTLEITVFDKAGEKVFDERVTAKTEDKIDFHYSKFSIGKLNGTKPQPADTKVLYDLMKKATDEITSQKFPK